MHPDLQTALLILQEIQDKNRQLEYLKQQLESQKKGQTDLILRIADYESRIVNKESAVQKIDTELQSERGAHIKIQNELRKQQSVRMFA